MKQILVIEDDDNIVYLIKHYFSKIEDSSYELSVATSLALGYKAIEENEYDAILLDLFLPDSSDHKSTVASLNDKFPGPVIVLTSLRDKTLAKELIRGGIEDYLYKDTLNEEILGRALRYAIERYRRNYQIQQAEKRFRMMAENNKDGILIIDKDKVVLYANFHAKQMLESELVGEGLGLPLPESGKMEIAIQLESKEEGVAEMSTSESQWNNEDVYMVILHDITQVKKKEEELLRLSKKLTQKNKELEGLNFYLEDFSQTVAHDLKNPTNLVSSFLEMIIEEDETIEKEERLDLTERALKCSMRMSSLIDDLLELAKNGLQPSSVKEISLSDIAGDVVQDLQLKINEKGANIAISELPYMLGNRSQVYQVFLNLIGNAIKFSKPDVPLKVKIYSKTFDRLGKDQTETKTKICQIFVEDNGIGFEEKYKQYIFKAFNRLHTEDEFEGHGIGLATVKRIITNHCGAIDVRSQLGEGTCFILTIPIELSDKASFLMRREPRDEALKKIETKKALYQNGKDHISFDVVDESDSGLGCEAREVPEFKEGMILIIDEDLFQVRWIRRCDEEKMQFGLKKV